MNFIISQKSFFIYLPLKLRTSKYLFFDSLEIKIEFETPGIESLLNVNGGDITEIHNCLR